MQLAARGPLYEGGVCSVTEHTCILYLFCVALLRPLRHASGQPRASWSGMGSWRAARGRRRTANVKRLRPVVYNICVIAT